MLYGGYNALHSQRLSELANLPRGSFVAASLCRGAPAGCSHQHGDTAPSLQGGNHFFLWPTISARIVRRSMRVRSFSIAGVSNEMCGISQRCSAMNQIGFSVVIQWR